MSPLSPAVAHIAADTRARLCAELAAIKPLTVAEACDEYAAHVHAMTDEQLAREVARVEALPGCEFRRLANEEADERRNHAALLAAMAPPTRWGCAMTFLLILSILAGLAVWFAEWAAEGND